MLLATLVFTSVALTCVMFLSRQSMLGFACAIFWFVAGAHSYTLVTGAPWVDIYFYLFIACTLGMTPFTIYAAFGLRGRDNESAGDDQQYYSENDNPKKQPKELGDSSSEDTGIDDGFESEPSRQTRELRERAEERKTKHNVKIFREHRRDLKW